MAAQAPGGVTTHRPLLIGAGIGCGCLSLLAAILVIVFVVAAVPKRPPAPPLPVQPTPPGQPIPPLPGPGPQPPGPPGVGPQPPGPVAPGQPAPGQPQAPPGPGPQPQPAPQQPGGALDVRIFTVRADQSGNPTTQQSQEFRVGERVIAIVALVAVPTTVNLGHILVKMEGNRPVPVAEPKIVRVDPSMAGKAAPFWFDRLPAGDYQFVVFVQGSGEESRSVAQAKFAVR